MNPPVSIITVVLNQAKALEETLTSILDQDYHPVQLIVIDGGSDPETIRVLKKHAIWLDELIIEPDEGIYDAMNKGLQLVKGHWVHFLNAGDSYAYEDSLSIMMESAQKTHSLVYCDVFLLDDKKKKQKQHKPIVKNNLFTSVCHQCVLYNYRKLKPLTFDTSYPVSADFNSYLETYFRDPEHFAIHVKEPLIEYQLGGFSDQRLPEILEERKRQFKEHIKNPVIRELNQLNLKRQLIKAKKDKKE